MDLITVDTDTHWVPIPIGEGRSHSRSGEPAGVSRVLLGIHLDLNETEGRKERWWMLVRPKESEDSKTWWSERRQGTLHGTSKRRDVTRESDVPLSRRKANERTEERRVCLTCVPDRGRTSFEQGVPG